MDCLSAGMNILNVFCGAMLQSIHLVENLEVAEKITETGSTSNASANNLTMVVLV